MLALAVMGNAVADSTAPKDLPIVDIADLVTAIMPKDGFDHMQWDYMVNSPIIRWKTAGTTTNNRGTYRSGLARVRVNGEMSKVLSAVLLASDAASPRTKLAYALG
jgi:hypothetical protein